MKKEFDITKVLVFGVFLIVLVLLSVCIVGDVINENNRIDEGIIVNKDMTPKYERNSVYANNGVVNADFYAHDDVYRFSIEGTKNGKTVTYTFEVTAEEYAQYKIGEWYKR